MAGQAAERRRTGVITEKLGMSRVFNDAGEHVPVTVLRVDNCQVIGQRTQRSGRLHGAPARRRRREGQEHLARRARPLREGADRAQAPSVRVPRERGCAGGRGRHARRRPLRRRPVRRCGRHVHRQGLRRRHEAAQLRGLAREPRRFRLAPLPRLDRPVPGPRQGVQGQEDGRSIGERAGDRAEPRGRGDGRRKRGPDHGEGRRARPEGRRRAALGREEAPPARRRSVPGRAPGRVDEPEPAEEAGRRGSCARAEAEAEEAAPEAEDAAESGEEESS